MGSRRSGSPKFDARNAVGLCKKPMNRNHEWVDVDSILLLVKAGRFTASDLLQKLNKQKHEHVVVVVVTATIGPLIWFCTAVLPGAPSLLLIMQTLLVQFSFWPAP